MTLSCLLITTRGIVLSFTYLTFDPRVAVKYKINCILTRIRDTKTVEWILNHCRWDVAGCMVGIIIEKYLFADLALDPGL